MPDHEYGLAHRATYVRCSACGSEYQQPMPGPDELASFYPPNYHSMTGGGLLLRMRHDVRARRLARLLTGDGAVLDYGCGDGGFLVHAARKLPGRRWYGYEIASRPERIELAAGAVTLVRGDLDDLLAVLPECRLITMNHVIEHLPQPLATLTRLCERLLPGGVFEGQTPAAGSLEHRLFKTRWSGYHAPRHTIVFSPDGLRRLLERAGLRDVAIEGTFNPAGLALSLASVRHGDAPGVLVRQGFGWLAWLGVAAALSPIDLLSGAPAVVDFAARKPEA
ncbi:MAG TPA: class I SAM-dependent methyltransferase [Candidatus Binatia bacterium]